MPLWRFWIILPFLSVIGWDGARMGCQDALMKAVKQILPARFENSFMGAVRGLLGICFLSLSDRVAREHPKAAFRGKSLLLIGWHWEVWGAHTSG